MNELDRLKKENEYMKTVIYNLFGIIERMNLIGSRTKSSPEYLQIKEAIHKLKGD